MAIEHQALFMLLQSRFYGCLQLPVMRDVIFVNEMLSVDFIKDTPDGLALGTMSINDAHTYARHFLLRVIRKPFRIYDKSGYRKDNRSGLRKGFGKDSICRMIRHEIQFAPQLFWIKQKLIFDLFGYSFGRMGNMKYYRMSYKSASRRH